MWFWTREDHGLGRHRAQGPRPTPPGAPQPGRLLGPGPLCDWAAWLIRRCRKETGSEREAASAAMQNLVHSGLLVFSSMVYRSEGFCVDELKDRLVMVTGARGEGGRIADTSSLAAERTRPYTSAVRL